jgi:CubicO group peptidase (beta-lactamase class C family)
VAFETFGHAHFSADVQAVRTADNDTLFSIYSVTKAITSAATWILLQEGKLALGDRVADLIPEFGSHGKDIVTVEQCLVHTAGFPSARFACGDWPDPARRLERFAGWPLEWPPGSRFVYHGSSTMWVLAELITRTARVDYRDFIRTRICEPLGLESLHVGLPDALHRRVADVIALGEPMSAEESATSPVDAPVIDEAMLGYANDPESRRIGGPGGGAIANAADVALFYQALLADSEQRGAGVWQAEMLHDAWRVRHPERIDGMTKQPALRGLGVVVAGDEGKMWRGFAESCSRRTFGHMGAGGQISWADPETSLSFVFLTNGAQQNPARQGANGFRLSTLAAEIGLAAA